MPIAQDNVILSGVGAHTSMGRLLRNYWVPAARAERVGEPGGAPLRLTVLGEQLVAFRSQFGAVTVMPEACPHRGASMALARNEGDGLRCVFHGWKFAPDGQLLETPSEPQDARGVMKRARSACHPCVESGGILWIWLGAGEPGPFPQFAFLDLPSDRVFGVTAVVDCHWLQGLEGDLDSAHVSILHQTEAAQGQLANVLDDAAPRDEIDPTPWGLRYAAVRQLRDGSRYVRVKPYVAPWYTIVPETPEGDRLWHAFVPLSDTQTLIWYLWYNLDVTVDPLRFADQFGFDLPIANPDNFREGCSADNLWGQDRASMQRGDSFCGIRGIAFQDIAIQESMGPLVERSREQLGRSDRSIVRARRLLLDAIETVEAGGTAPGCQPDVDYREITSSVERVGAPEAYDAGHDRVGITVPT